MSRSIFFCLLLFLGLMVGGVVSVAAQELTVQGMQKDGIGQYLADGKGMTLYYFAKDWSSPHFDRTRPPA